MLTWQLLSNNLSLLTHLIQTGVKQHSLVTHSFDTNWCKATLTHLIQTGVKQHSLVTHSFDTNWFCEYFVLFDLSLGMHCDHYWRSYCDCEMYNSNKSPFVYINLFISEKLDSLSFSFTSISLLTNSSILF